MERQNVALYDPMLCAPLTKKWEGLELIAYKCPAGVWTIGYGHTRGVKQGMKITKEKAIFFLIADLDSAHLDLMELCKVPLTKGEFVAMLDFVFNFGIEKCREYIVFKLLNAGKYKDAGEYLTKYHFSGKKSLDGLINRRNEERAFFLGEETYLDADGKINNRSPFGE